MKKVLYSLLFLFMLISPFGCKTKVTKVSPGKINLEELRFLQEKNGNQNVKIIDVRTEVEFFSDHIPGAENIDIEKGEEYFENEIKERYPNKSTIIVVYCRSGNRSSRAWKLLDKLNYINIFDFGALSNYK